jgi:hypothetical protein
MNFLSNIYQKLTILPEKVIINENSILEWLGYENGQADEFVLDSIRRYISQTKYLVSPSGGIVLKKVQSLSGGILCVDNTEFNVGRIIAGQLKNAEYIVLFIVTIGNEIEKLSDKLFHQGEMLEGYIVNLIGSEAAEGISDYVHRSVIAKELDPGISLTNRFSPGYCNWDVAEQFKLFGAFPKSFNSVSLTDSALMTPVKSVSGIIGIGKDVKFGGYKCNLCKDEKCIYRKKKVKD